MNKYYLEDIKVIENELDKYKEGNIIIFEMPPFCSGDYQTEIFKDEKGLYIKEYYFPVYYPKGNYYSGGARDWKIKKRNNG